MDLLSSIINKVKSTAQSLGKKINDNEGFIQQGRPTLEPIRQAITNWASQPQNYQKAQALQTWEPLFKPIETAKQSLASQNINSPQQFFTKVFQNAPEGFKTYVENASNKVGLPKIIPEVVGTKGANMLRGPSTFFQNKSMYEHIGDLIISAGSIFLPQEEMAAGAINPLFTAGGSLLSKGKFPTKDELTKSVGEGMTFGAKFGVLNKIIEPFINPVTKKISSTAFGNINSWVRAFKNAPDEAKGVVLKKAVELFGREAVAKALKGAVSFGTYEALAPAKTPQERLKNFLEGVGTGAAFEVGQQALGTGLSYAFPRIKGLSAQAGEKIPFGLSTKEVKKGSINDLVSRAVKEGNITVEEGQAILNEMAKRPKIKIKQPVSESTNLTELGEARKTTPPLPEIPVGESGGVGGLSDNKAPKGFKERGFTSTVKESPTTPKKVAEKVSGFYKPISNEETLANANNTINILGFEKAEKQVLSGELTAENVAIGEALSKRYMEIGDFDKATKLLDELAIKATKGGQAIQAFSIYSRFTPEGMVEYAKKAIEKANNTMPLLNKIFGKKTSFTAEDSKNIYNMMKEVEKLPEGDAKNEATRKVFDYIGKKLPWGVSDVIDEMRYNNMLSNPLTHLRNAINNLQQTFITRPATLLAEGKPKEAIKYEIGALSSLPDALDNFLKTFKEGAKFGKLDTEGLSQLEKFKPKRLGAWNIPSTALEAADRFFSTLIKGGEMARGISKEEAERSAEYYLFRSGLNEKKQGFLLNKIDDITRAAYQLRKVGLGWFIPFIRTPMNVAKQWIEYSPAGFATMIGAENKKEQFAKALLGSIITVIGAKLALEGRTTWSAPTDPTQKKLFYDSGRKPYSIKIGNKWVPMQYLGVYSWAVGIPAAIKEYTENSRTALTDDQITKLTKILGSIAGFWSNQTFVSGLGSFVELAKGNTDYTLSKNLAFTASQLKPFNGLLRYISTVIDPIFRKPETFGQQMVSDIPFLTKTLPAYTNTLGEPSQRNLSNYIAPYAIGIENKQFEEPYLKRTEQLQENALINKTKSDLEKSGTSGQKTVGNKILLTTKDGVKVVDLSKVTPTDTDTNYQKAIKLKKAFSYVDEVLDSDLSVEEQAQVLSKLGITPEQASYYNVARQPNDIKYIYVKDEISKYGDNRQQILSELIKMRQEVNNKMILSNEVVNDLVDEGILSKEEGKMLKNVKYTDKGEVKVKLTGVGRSAKIKKITLKASKLSFKVPKLKAVEFGGIRKSAKISNRGKILKVRKVKIR